MLAHGVEEESPINQYCQFTVGLLFCVITGRYTMLVVIPYHINFGCRERQNISLSVAPEEPSIH